jgi:hypothetical protein
MARSLRQRIAVGIAALGLVACDAQAPPRAETAAESEPKVPPAEVRPALDPAQLAAAQAIEEAVRDRDPFVRAQRLATLLPTLGPEGVPGARQVLEDTNRSLGGAEIELLARFWALHEPEAASRWAATKSPVGYRLSAILAAFPLWVAVDPEAALAANQEWEKHPTARDGLHIGLVRGWYARSPTELHDFIRTLDVGFTRQRLLAIYIRLLLQEQGPDAVIGWAESIPDDDESYTTDVYRQVAVALPAFDLDAAFRWCQAHCDGPDADNLRSIIAMRWAQLGGGLDALTWLGNAPQSPDRDGSLSRVFDEWMAQAPDEAEAWLVARSQAEDAEPWLSLLYWNYAVRRMEVAPAEAVEWGARVEDPQDRQRLLVMLARMWRAKDEAAAEAWLSQSPLPEDARARARQKGLGTKPVAPTP